MHLSDVQLGIMASSFMWVYAAAAPFAGLVGDRFRRKCGDSRRADLLVADYAGDRACDALLASGVVPRARRLGRGVLLPGVDVADQRVARQRDAVARHELASIERVRGDDRGRDGGGLPGGALRMAQRILRVRLARRAAGAGAAGAAERARRGSAARGREVSASAARGAMCCATRWRAR